MIKQILNIMFLSSVLNRGLLQDGFGNFDKIFKQFDKAFDKDFKGSLFKTPFFETSFDTMFNNQKNIINENEHTDSKMKERAKKINKLSKRHETYKTLKTTNDKLKDKIKKNSKKFEKLDSISSIFNNIKNKDTKTETIIKNYKDGTTIEIMQKTISPNVQMVVEKIDHLSKPLLNEENHESIKTNIKSIKEIQNDLHNKNGNLDNFFDDSSFFEKTFKTMISQIGKNFDTISKNKKNGKIDENHPLFKNLDFQIKKLEEHQSHIKIDNLRNVHKKQIEMINLQDKQNFHLNNMKEIEDGIKNKAEEKEDKIREIVRDLDGKKDISENKKKEVRNILSVISE